MGIDIHQHKEDSTKVNLRMTSNGTDTGKNVTLSPSELELYTGQSFNNNNDVARIIDALEHFFDFEFHV